MHKVNMNTYKIDVNFTKYIDKMYFLKYNKDKKGGKKK